MLEQGELNIQSHDLVVEKINLIDVGLIEKVFYIGSSFCDSVKRKNRRDNVFFAENFKSLLLFLAFINEKLLLFSRDFRKRFGRRN